MGLLCVRASRAPCREEGEIPVADIAADQQAAGPQPRLGLVIFGGVEIGEFTVDPVTEPGALGAFASRKALPCNLFEVSHDLRSGARDRRFARPSAEVVVRIYPQNRAFAGSGASLFDVADAIHGVRRNPGERHIGCQRTRYQLKSECRLGGEGYSFRDIGRDKPRRIASSALGQVQSSIDKGVTASGHIS